MKKQLMKSMLSVLIISVLVLTTFFIMIINNQYNQNIIENLKKNNQFIISIVETRNIVNYENFFRNNLDKLESRVTYIDKEGNVIADSLVDSESMDNHNSRPEVQEARKNGVGYSFRYSNTLRERMLYVATSFDNGYVIRSSVPVDFINSFENRYIRYYVMVLVCVIFAAALVSSRVSHVILKPIKDLQYITSRVANGELFRRVNLIRRDEIGDLGKAFNDMADKLQNSMKEVLERQNRLEAILKSMDSGVIAVDRNYRIIMINPYAKEIFGINTDVIGQPLMGAIRDFELERILKDNSEEYTEIKLLRPKERDLRIRTADIVSDNELIGIVAVVQDITDINRLENMRSQFVANVSHELKTPLTSIKGFAETLKFVDDPDKREKFLDIINDEAERLTRLINDILILSSLEQHRETKKEPIDVNEIIQDVYYLMKNEADRKEIKLQLLINRRIVIKGDRDRFKQMVINLVDNAIKYSEPGDSVSVGTDESEETYVIWVEDTGVGMSKEHLSRIFERFYRIDKARSRSQGGTGLGLAIVKHIVLNLDGTIDVESQPGRGSKFIVKIPNKG